MAGYYQICPNISISSLTDHAGILWGQKSDDFGDFCGAIYFNTSDQLVLSGHSSTVYSTSSDNLFSVDSPSGSSLVLKADDGTVDWNRPEMTLYGDLSVTGCIHGTTSTISISTDNGICGGGPLSASRNFALSGQASNLHNATFSNGDLLAKDGNGTFVGVTSSDFVVAVSGGNCISVTSTDSNNITVNHSDTSSLLFSSLTISIVILIMILFNQLRLIVLVTSQVYLQERPLLVHLLQLIHILPNPRSFAIYLPVMYYKI